MTGLTTSNLRFNIAKLIPGTNEGQTAWQYYINGMETRVTLFPGRGCRASGHILKATELVDFSS